MGENHAVSGLKFRILRRFLDLGYAVLLSDVDIVTLQNPFQFLARDCDVESMSDGWDNATAYGGPGASTAHALGAAGVGSWGSAPALSLTLHLVGRHMGSCRHAAQEAMQSM